MQKTRTCDTEGPPLETIEELTLFCDQNVVSLGLNLAVEDDTS